MNQRVDTEWQRPLSGMHSTMMEKFAQAGEGGGCRPTPCHYSYHQVQSCSVRSSWVGDTLTLFHLYQYMNACCPACMAFWRVTRALQSYEHGLYSKACISQLITETLFGNWSGGYMRTDSFSQHSLYGTTVCPVPNASASKGVMSLLPARPGYMACWVERLCMKCFWYSQYRGAAYREEKDKERGWWKRSGRQGLSGKGVLQ